MFNVWSFSDQSPMSNCNQPGCIRSTNPGISFLFGDYVPHEIGRHEHRLALGLFAGETPAWNARKLVKMNRLKHPFNQLAEQNVTICYYS